MAAVLDGRTSSVTSRSVAATTASRSSIMERPIPWRRALGHHGQVHEMPHVSVETRHEIRDDATLVVGRHPRPRPTGSEPRSGTRAATTGTGTPRSRSTVPGPDRPPSCRAAPLRRSASRGPRVFHPGDVDVGVGHPDVEWAHRLWTPPLSRCDRPRERPIFRHAARCLAVSTEQYAGEPRGKVGASVTPRRLPQARLTPQ